MLSPKTRRLVGLLILLISLALLIWGIWPELTLTYRVPIGPGQMQAPTPTSWMAIWEALL